MDLDLRKKENLHIVFWLVKDFSWLMGFKILGMSMALPTLLLAFWITWRSRTVASDFYHALAVTCWICGNTIWMAGEFYCKDCTRMIAMPAFIAGLACLAFYYIRNWIQNYMAKKSGSTGQ